MLPFRNTSPSTPEMESGLREDVLLKTANMPAEHFTRPYYITWLGNAFELLYKVYLYVEMYFYARLISRD